MNIRRQNGFTLIELMVVILVIALLAVMVFRMVAAVGKGNDKAETRAKLEKVGHALEEFRALYGKYPPVPTYPDKCKKCGKEFNDARQHMEYEYPMLDSRGWGDTAERKRATAKLFLDYEKESGRIQWGEGSDRGIFYTFGLVSFFLPRYNGTAARGPQALAGLGSGGQDDGGALNQWQLYNKKNPNAKRVGDSAKDMNACRKILPYLDGGIDEAGNIDYGIITSPDWPDWGRSPARALNCGIKAIVVTNYYSTIKDAWMHELRYDSRAPYESYVLRSPGPDGASVHDQCERNDHGHTKKTPCGCCWIVQDGDPETEDDIIAGME